MTPLIIPWAILCSLALTGIAVSLFAVYRSNSFRRRLDTFARELKELREEPALAEPAVQPKAGLNMSKRSQALVMHRHGEASDKIAAALEVPCQEIELLIKVHRIVMSTIVG